MEQQPWRNAVSGLALSGLLTDALRTQPRPICVRVLLPTVGWALSINPDSSPDAYLMEAGLQVRFLLPWGLGFPSSDSEE